MYIYGKEVNNSLIYQVNHKRERQKGCYVRLSEMTCVRSSDTPNRDLKRLKIDEKIIKTSSTTDTFVRIIDAFPHTVSYKSLYFYFPFHHGKACRRVPDYSGRSDFCD